jgi:predicted  nucleic acid-binding Zn-ribbon protein
MCGKGVLMCVAGAALSMLIAACDTSDSDSAGGAKLPSSDSIKSATESAQQSASALISSAQQQLSNSLANSQEMYEKLKSEAAQFNDEKLKSIMAALQGKLDTARANIAKLKDANQVTMEAIQNDVNAALAEVKTLYDQALARIAELRSGAAGSAK